MALIIVFKLRRTTQWHVGSPKPLSYEDITSVEYIQADGHELDLIKNTFDNTLIMPHKVVVRWYGDIAKTIIGNLF